MSQVESSAKRWGLRSIAAIIIFAIAAALTPVAMIGHWGHRTIIDSSVYMETVTPLASSPEIQQVVATTITDSILANVDTTAMADGLLGSILGKSPLADSLAAPIAAGVNGLISGLVAKFVASSEFQKLWVTLNEAAQKSLVAILEGRHEGPLQLSGDNLVLDISSLLTAVQAQLVAKGVTIADKITVPTSMQQVVLLQSPAIGQIQFIYSLTSPILEFFPLLIAALFGLSIALARRRARMVLATGLALIVMSGVTLWAMSFGETIFIDQLADTVFASASVIFWATFFQYLLTGLQALLIFGVIVAVAGWLSGRSRPANSVRGGLVRGLNQIGQSVPKTGFSNFLGSKATLVRWIICTVLVLVLVLGDVMSTERMIWLSLLTAGLFTLLAILTAPAQETVDQGQDQLVA